MKLKPALTMIETVLVIGLIAVLSVPFIVSIPNIKSKLALKSSGENMANVLRAARVYAREERDEKSWGVRYVNSDSYALISGESAESKQDALYILDPPVKFKKSFHDIWFAQGSGEPKNKSTIEIVNPNGLAGTIEVSKLGLVKYTGP